MKYKTGISKIDEILKGGLNGKELSIIVGNPNNFYRKSPIKWEVIDELFKQNKTLHIKLENNKKNN